MARKLDRHAEWVLLEPDFFIHTFELKIVFPIRTYREAMFSAHALREGGRGRGVVTRTYERDDHYPIFSTMLYACTHSCFLDIFSAFCVSHGGLKKKKSWPRLDACVQTLRLAFGPWNIFNNN